MNLRPYQQRAVAFLQGKQRAFVVAPAGSGKTIIAAAAIKAAMQPGSGSDITEHARIVWLANTLEQVEQAKAAAEKFGVRIEAHCVAAQPDCSLAHLVIVDEAHHMPAATWTATIGSARCAVWGFSATPWSTSERDDKLRSYFKDFIVIPRDEVLEHGAITKGIVYVHDIDAPGAFDPQIDTWTEQESIRRCRRFPFIAPEEHERRARWQATAESVRNNAERNRVIVHMANGSDDPSLILVSTIDHGAELATSIWDCALVHAKLARKHRQKLINDFREGALHCLIATSLADEGLDVPRASVLILAAGGRSAAKLEQRAGRVMRPHEGKEFGTVHDFADRGAKLAHSQFLARARTYKKLGYTIINANQNPA